ncbi:hypothetical protein PHMEG_00036265 [Phytophthora megakarya]|uniref:Reverse transcriptase n=1 Tax=Phytophthora megakarya TaxID=4795 RepID=A0A225ULY0_9STRA|nr:hypothetical protein PHMEG_00036265 [Phytophthora megakarya]
MGHYARRCTAPIHSSQGQRGDTGYRHGQTKKWQGPVGAGRPTGNAVTRVYNGHAVLRTAAPSERESHCKSLPLMDFEEKHVPRSQLEVRLATGAIVKTEKRAIRARFSYKHRVFVEELLVLDLDE